MNRVTNITCRTMSGARLGGFAYRYDALDCHVYDDDWQVIADLDESGNVVARWTYDAWGNVLTEEIADPAVELRAVRYRFQGREWSAATGLTNFRMRWYDPVTGRWLSKDPIRLSGGLNLYAFCDGDPANQIDSNGLCPDAPPPSPPIAQLGPARPGPSGKTYYADPTGHGVNPSTGVPKDPHIHQRPVKGPDRIFNMDGTPRDGGPKLPKKDIGPFLKAVGDVIRRTGGRLISLPIVVAPVILFDPIPCTDNRDLLL